MQLREHLTISSTLSILRYLVNAGPRDTVFEPFESGRLVQVQRMGGRKKYRSDNRLMGAFARREKTNSGWIWSSDKGIFHSLKRNRPDHLAVESKDQ